MRGINGLERCKRRRTEEWPLSINIQTIIITTINQKKED